MIARSRGYESTLRGTAAASRARRVKSITPRPLNIVQLYSFLFLGGGFGSSLPAAPLESSAAPGPERVLVARQRSEQYFTFAQSRSHFFRQAKGRPQTTQVLVGRSALRRIPAIGSPRHWLAAPVEKTAVCVCRESIDDGEQMSGRGRGGMNLQPRRRERSG